MDQETLTTMMTEQTEMSQEETTVITESTDTAETQESTAETTVTAEMPTDTSAEMTEITEMTAAGAADTLITEDTEEFVTVDPSAATGVTSVLPNLAETTSADVEQTTQPPVTLLPEETLEVTTTAATAVPAPVPQSQGLPQETVNNLIMMGIIVIVGIIAFFAITRMGGRTKKEKTAETAREIDKARIEKERGKQKKKKEKGRKTTSKVKLPKTVADTMPYKKVMPNDIWLLAENTYSKVYRTQDINYNLGDEEQQESILEQYCNFLNTLDETLDVQITVLNDMIDVKGHEKAILIPYTTNDVEAYRQEYNEMLRTNLSKGQNAIRKSIYITATVHAPDYESAVRRFNSLDLEFKNSFDMIGSTKLEPLTNQQRCEIVKNVFRGADETLEAFTENDFDRGVEKLYISPDYFEFKTDYFMFGSHWAKTVFIKEFPKTASDGILNELMAQNIRLIVTTNLLAYDSGDAKKLVQHQITAINTNMGERESKAAKAGNFSATIPVKYKNQIDSYTNLYNKLSEEDQKLFTTCTVIMIIANSYEEMVQHLEIVNSTLKRNGCTISEMKWQQEDGLCDVLPIGTQRRFQWDRAMPTESIGILMPYNVKEMQMGQAIYYGLNKLSNNMLTFDRTRDRKKGGVLINPAGFILGSPGAGKSFTTKREMTDAFMRYPDAQFIIIDPEREYAPIVSILGGESVKISTGSSSYINPFDFDFRFLDEEQNDDDDHIDIIADKCQLIISFISCMYNGRPLTPQETSFIDRCVRQTYEQSGVLLSLDKRDMPTLSDFYEIVRAQDDVDEKMQKDLLITLEMYVTGSAKYFNNRTNVNTNSRIMSYDIKDLSGVLKTQAMLLVLDNVWNTLSANRDKGRNTWIYIDEIHVLFANDYCLQFIRMLYKRARKYGGVLTGITQNVEDLLRNDECRTMLSNSEFLVLLKQSASDSLQLKEALHFTESELSFVNNVGSGEGLLIIGGDKIPFYDRFPADTKLYRAMSTAFSETREMQKNIQEKSESA